MKLSRSSLAVFYYPMKKPATLHRLLNGFYEKFFKFLNFVIKWLKLIATLCSCRENIYEFKILLSS